MSSSQETSLWSELTTGLPAAEGKRAYFQSRIRNHLYDFIVKKFEERKAKDSLTKAELARRMGRKPEVINRYLAAPGNWTLDTVSDLLLCIAAEELEPASRTVANIQPHNLDGNALLEMLKEKDRKLAQPRNNDGAASRGGDGGLSQLGGSPQR